MLLAQDCRGVTTIKISACVIVKNEERNLPRWLECVKAFADEIIVVDTGSEDRTVEIAEAGGAAVYYFKWCNDFSAAKNYALDKATGDWIVFLDADEYFDETGRKELRTALNRIHGNHDIIGIDSLLYNIDVDHNDMLKSTANQKRIFRNLKQLRYQGRIHEYLMYYGDRGVRFLTSKEPAIYHTGYSASINRSKNQRNLDLLLADIDAVGGEKPSHYSYLSVCYFNLQQYDKAIHYAKLAVQSHDQSIKSALIKQYWIWFKGEQIRNAPHEVLQKIIDTSLSDIPGHPDFLWEDAKLALQRRDFLLAEQRLAEILEQVKNKKLMREYESSISGQLHIVYAALGKILETKGHIKRAANYYRKALQDDPYKENVLQDLLKLSVYMNPREMICWLDNIYKTEKDRAFLNFYLKNYPRNELYLYYMHPAEGSYEEQMGRGDYRKAVLCGAKKLSNILGSIEYLGSKAIVDEAADAASELVIALLLLPTETFSTCTRECSLLPQGLQKILLRFHNSSLLFTADDITAYGAVLDDVLQYGTPDLMDRFGLLSLDFDLDTILQVAVKLFEKGRWMSVLTLYAKVPKKKKELLPGFWYYKGICLFHLGVRESAHSCLLQAQMMGMNSPDLPSYLAWCRETKPESKINPTDGSKVHEPR